MQRLTLLLILFMVLRPVSAQNNLFPQLGGQRAGTSSFSFLRVEVGAAAHAMAGSYTAIGTGASSLFWNPAGAAQGTRGLDIMIDQSRWIADFKLSSFAAVWKLGQVHYLGVSAVALYAPPTEITTEYRPDGTGEYFNFGDVLLGLTYAQRMTDRFSFGISTKLVEEQLADLTMRNVLLDLGTYYRTGYKDLRFAVSLLNFGTPSKPQGVYQRSDSTETEYEAFSPPTIFRLGVAHEWLQSDRQTLTTSIQLNHPVDNAESISLGLEYGLVDRVFFRTGYATGDDARSWTFGLGLKWSDFKFDYSYADMGDLNHAQHLSLGWSL